MALVHLNHYSYYLGMDIPMDVILPEKRGQEPRKHRNSRYPVLYLLHGHSDDNTCWIRKSNIELLIRDYNVIVVMPNGHRGFYTNGEQGQLYFDYFTKEIPVVVGNYFPVSDKREDTYIAGLSMGGYGALKLALSCPFIYGTAASMSGAVDAIEARRSAKSLITAPDFSEHVKRVFGDGETYRGSNHDLRKLALDVIREGGPMPKIYQSCGRQDPLYESNFKFKDFMKKNWKAELYHYQESDGEHNWEFWNRELPCILKYMSLLEDGMAVI